MGTGKFLSLCFALFFGIALLQLISVEAFADIDTLYGIISSGNNEGYLIKIDTATGQATLVGQTGLSRPCVLEYNSRTDTLLSSNCFGYPAQGFAIDPDTGAASLVVDSLAPNAELSYSYAQDALYAVEPGVNDSVLIKLNPTTGDWIDSVGVINKGPVTGLDIDPTNNTMYGVGMYNGTWWLFTVNTATGPPPRESNVGQVNRSLSGIAFNSQGNKLYATDGARLLTIDKSTGAVAEVGPFGADIGFVADIALVPGSFDRLRVRPPRIEYTPTFFALAELVREGMPWCPAGFPGCPGGRLSFHNRETDIPPHVLELGKDVQGIARARSDAKLFAKGLRGLQATVQRVPLGDHFDKEIKKQLADAIDSSMRKSSKTTSKEFLSTPILIKALNAVELDWRLPKIQKQTANKGQYIGIDLGGIVWVGLRDVVKPGDINLRIKSRYEAFPAGLKYSASWPFLSYIIDCDAELGPYGFLDITFYVKPLQFKNKVSGIRVLQLDKGGMIDVTSGSDLSRGVVMARTNRAGTFIIVGKD